MRLNIFSIITRWPIRKITILLMALFICNRLYMRYLYYEPNFPTEVRESKRVLIASCNGGAGHKIAAQALKEKLQKMDCHVDILYADDYWFMNTIIQSYNNALTHKTGRWIYNNIGLYLCPYIAQYIKITMPHDIALKHKYNTIICCTMLTGLYLDKLKYTKIPSVVIPTDLLSIHPSVWFDNSTSSYIIPITMQDQATHIPENRKYFVEFPPIRSAFFDDRASKIERKKQLELDVSKKAILVCFGGAGSLQSIDIMNYVVESEYCLEHQYVFVCGNNANLELKLSNLKQNLIDQYMKANNTDKADKIRNNFIIKGFVDNMHQWMQGCDIVIGKPGPGIILECLASNLMFITSSSEVLMQEQFNLQFIDKYKMGAIIDDFKMPYLEQSIQSLLSLPTPDFSNIMTHNPTDDIVEEIMRIIDKNLTI